MNIYKGVVQRAQLQLARFQVTIIYLSKKSLIYYVYFHSCLHSDKFVLFNKTVTVNFGVNISFFQWLYEDNLLQCPMRGNNMITPARATVMADLKKVPYTFCRLNELIEDTILTVSPPKQKG